MKYLFGFIILLMISSCGNDDNGIGGLSSCDADDFEMEVADELDNLNQAGMTFSNNPTSDNCDAFVAAAQSYIDAVEDFDVDGCAGLSQAEFNEVLQAARAALDAILCN